MVFIGPKNKEVASKLLAAAAEAGLSPKVVVAKTDGFEVPQEVVDIFEGKTKKKSTRKSKAEAVPEADDSKEGND
jgi:ornithine carbamoyltransferase